MTQYCI